MMKRAVVTWFLMIPVAIVNGTIRQVLVEPRIGRLPAHQVSVATGSAAFLALAWAMLRGEAPQSPDRTLWRIGAGWVGATILFECGFGHYLRGMAWSDLLADYNVRRGRLWVVVLAVVFAAPRAVKRLASRQHTLGTCR